MTMQEAMDLLDETLDNAFHACKALDDHSLMSSYGWQGQGGDAGHGSIGARGSTTPFSGTAGANGPGEPGGMAGR